MLNPVFFAGAINIAGQYLQTDDELGYAVVDFGITDEFDIRKFDELKRIEGTLRARIFSR